MRPTRNRSRCSERGSAPCRSSRTIIRGPDVAASASAGDLLEQLGAAQVRVAGPRGGQGAHVRAQRAQHLRPRPEGGGGGLVGAAAPGHPDPHVDGGGRGLLGETGLADARLPADEHHRPADARHRPAARHRREPRDQGGQLGTAADESGRPRAGGRRRGCGPQHRIRWSRTLDGRVVGEDRLFEAPQFRTGIDAQLVAQQVAAAGEGAQGVGLTPGAVEREHQRSPQPLAQRMRRDQSLQLGRGVLRPARRQHRLDVPFQAHLPQLHQPRPVGLHRRPAVTQVGVRLAAPQVQRPEQRVVGVARPSGVEQSLPVREQTLEPEHVELVGADRDQVTGRAGQQPDGRGPGGAVGFEQPAQLGDVGLQGAGGGRGWLARPQRLVDPVLCDDPAVVGEQQRQQRPQLRAAGIDLGAVGRDDLQRLQHAELHARTVGTPGVPN